MIEGWNEGLALMTVGAKHKLVIPYQLAYGEQGLPGTIPPKATLIFEVELLEIVAVPFLPAFAMTAPSKLQKTATGLGYEVLREGTGKKPAMGKEVTVHYAGWLTDGTLFDSSYARGEMATFRLGEVITGFSEGLQMMREGAIYKFTIPGNLAYGSSGAPPTIGPNATLVFVVELSKVGS